MSYNNQYTKGDLKWCGKVCGISAKRYHNIWLHWRDMKMTKRDFSDLEKYKGKPEAETAKIIYKKRIELLEGDNEQN